MAKTAKIKFYVEFKNKEGKVAFIDHKNKGCEFIANGKDLVKMMMAIWRYEKGCKSFKEYKEKTGKSGKDDYNEFFTTVIVNGANIKDYNQTNFEYYRLMLI